MLRRIAAIPFFLVFATFALGAPAPHKEKPPRFLRVLLFAGSTTREYQFLRSLLMKENEGKRAELSILLQPPPGREKRPGVVQDVPAERLLDTFPTKLDSYDVIVAFDPDWTRLKPEAQSALQQWVKRKGGGLILIAGPINTCKLARPALQRQFASISDLYPVVLCDDRVETDIDNGKPHRLTFARTKTKYPYLKVDDKGQDNLAGWTKFFNDDKSDEAKKDEEPKHGFYSCYPVDSVKTDAVVLAAFDDPKARMKDGKQQPYLVAWNVDKGRVMYVGSGELWRLRQCRREYYERFWLGLLNHIGAAKVRD